MAGSSRGQLRALLLLGLVHSLELLADMLDAGSTSAADLGRIAVVGVDSDQGRHVLGLDVLDNNLARALALVVAAVAARAVKLACVHNSESINGDGSGTVVLHNLVLGLLGAATLDEGISGAEDGNGVLKGTY